jgi:hypothetical protein
MIKSEIRSLIKNQLPRFEEKERLHDRVIDAIVEKVLAEFYNIIFLRNPLELARYTKEFGYTVPLPLVLEGATGIYYTSYPTGVSIVPVPDKASGVRRVSTPTQSGASFYPMDSREHDLIMSGSYVSQITAKIGYIPRRTRIEYFNPTVAVIASGVRADLLIPFSCYADTDTVLVPEIVDQEGKGFIDKVVGLLSKIPPVDLIENTKEEENK